MFARKRNEQVILKSSEKYHVLLKYRKIYCVFCELHLIPNKTNNFN